MVGAAGRLLLKGISWAVSKILRGTNWEDAWYMSRRVKAVARDAFWRAEEAELQAGLAAPTASPTARKAHSAEWFENNHVRLLYVITTGRLCEAKLSDEQTISRRCDEQLQRLRDGDEHTRIWFEDVCRRVQGLVDRHLAPGDQLLQELSDALNDAPDEAGRWRASLIEIRLRALMGGVAVTQEQADHVLEHPVQAAVLPRPVRSWWLELAQVMATWCAAQGQVDDWSTICDVVEAGATPEMRRARGWVHEERAAIARLHGDTRSARAELAEAAKYRGSRAKAQHLHNKALVKLDRRRVDGGNIAAASEDLELASRLQFRHDATGHALTELAQGVAGICTADGLEGTARVHEMQRAGQVLENARSSFAEHRQLRAEAAAATNLVLTCWAAGDPDGAQQNGLDALGIYERLRDRLGRDDRPGRAAALLNLGAVLLHEGAAQVDRARQYLEESLDLWDELSTELSGNGNVRQGLGRTHLYLGDVAVAQRRLGDAAVHWQRAETLCREVADEAGASEAASRRQRSSC